MPAPFSLKRLAANSMASRPSMTMRIAPSVAASSGFRVSMLTKPKSIAAGKTKIPVAMARTKKIGPRASMRLG